ncbi:hypothetical protein GH714_016260 [Hevea brasiliensis]|uniref:Pectinesterase inhibitor domain-containing protein n=1 Tax=Hevea brasiliensis TaxID=3981 RepID=A0A6A6M1U2_HEVBR|nr:hypothetical protein GH714_016260 [Hevea brasiliensis]
MKFTAGWRSTGIGRACWGVMREEQRANEVHQACGAPGRELRSSDRVSGQEKRPNEVLLGRGVRVVAAEREQLVGEQSTRTSAVNVSLQAATNASSLVTALLKEGGLNHTEAQAVQDCLEVIGDSIDELNESLDALGSLDFNNPKVKFQISNIKTWVSAAITDDDTCTDGLNGAKVSSSVKTKITKSVLNVERLTSNALALINSKLPYYY